MSLLATLTQVSASSRRDDSGARAGGEVEEEVHLSFTWGGWPHWMAALERVPAVLAEAEAEAEVGWLAVDVEGGHQPEPPRQATVPAGGAAAGVSQQARCRAGLPGGRGLPRGAAAAGSCCPGTWWACMTMLGGEAVTRASGPPRQQQQQQEEARAQDCFASLKALLECDRVTKLLYDVRCDAEALYHQHGVRLGGVVDLQLAEVGLGWGGGVPPPRPRRLSVKCVVGLRKALHSSYLRGSGPQGAAQWAAARERKVAVGA
ncbi:hypothetical protein HYH02_000743 [Chlamydomonas schloesseri]|uniref:3'-5' exonuclease domain-containing protein n=1 Tax=Chlamydomonas schloesseri TaxID=2026947 RepID=A0A836BD69_9CHLO|nr:hypothetical protein HYH02_000743 [Chlamydomonas schloesseri]|eukprot:KAG2454913.1 hypothetical protein HYH02_000743 [Chlamydomonas schloesseri]